MHAPIYFIKILIGYNTYGYYNIAILVWDIIVYREFFIKINKIIIKLSK